MLFPCLQFVWLLNVIMFIHVGVFDTKHKRMNTLILSEIPCLVKMQTRCIQDQCPDVYLPILMLIVISVDPFRLTAKHTHRPYN